MTEPDFAGFCRQISETMSEQLSSSVRTVSLYQEIWYLVNKYSIPVTDHDQDIVILIDNICRGVTKKPEPVLDNSIEIDDPALKSFVYHSPALPEVSVLGHSQYSQVVKFPQFPLTRPTTPEPQVYEDLTLRHKDDDFTEPVSSESSQQPLYIGGQYPKVSYHVPRPPAEDREAMEDRMDTAEPITLHPELILSDKDFTDPSGYNAPQVRRNIFMGNVKYCPSINGQSRQEWTTISDK